MEFIDLLGFLIAGLAGGFLSGMLGVGGGIIFVPVVQQVLINHFIREDFVAYTLANSLAIVFVVGISGTLKQLKLKNTDMASAFTTGISAIVSSLTLTWFIHEYEMGDKKVFNIIFSVILVLTLIRMLASGRNDVSEKNALSIPPVKQFIPAGLFAGVITALSGLGGGIVMVPYFNKILKLPIKFATGLSLSVIPIIAFPLLLFYSTRIPAETVYSGYQTGYLLWPVILPVIAVAVFASRFGVWFAQKLSPQTIKWIFVTFVCLTLVKVLFLSGS